MGRNSGSGGRGRRPGAAGVRQGVAGGAPVATAQPPQSNTPTSRRAALLTPSQVAVQDGGRAISFRTASGNRVRMSITSYGNIVFTVNDSTTRNRMSQDERNAVSLRLLQHIREDARTRPNGFKYDAVAAGGDGYQQQRAMAYEAIGLSRPLYGIEGRSQYGIVQNGRIRPDTARLQAREENRFGEYNQSWNITKGEAQARRAGQRQGR